MGKYATVAGITPSIFRTVEINVGTMPRYSGRFDITGLSGLTPGKPARVFQIDGPYTGKGTLADEAQMDQLQVAASCISSTMIRCFWIATGAVAGNFKFGYRS